MLRLQGVVSWVPMYANRYNFYMKIKAFPVKKMFILMAVFREEKVRLHCMVPSGAEL